MSKVSCRKISMSDRWTDTDFIEACDKELYQDHKCADHVQALVFPAELELREVR